ncbi:hypothetical protein [Sorangium sp. So ce887]|uniref:hypothetical protein n=1 Tax=Sorangium sp. So ce887 TaxID=3133324 RepID=UPI003F5F3D93
MERSFVMVFDDTLSDMHEGAAVPAGAGFIRKYTSLEHTDMLSSAGQLCFQAVMQRIGGIRDLPLEITMEHSANGYDWKPKYSGSVLSGVLLEDDETATFAGGESWPGRSSLRFVRLRIDVGDASGGSGAFSVALKVYATVRKRGADLLSWDEDGDFLSERLPLADILFGVRGEVLDELRELVLGAGHLEGEARYAEVIGGMSLRSKREVFGLVRRVQHMDAESKRLLLSVGRGVVKLLSAELGEEEEDAGSRAEHAPTPDHGPAAQDERDGKRGDLQAPPCAACEGGGTDQAPVGVEAAEERLS